MRIMKPFVGVLIASGVAVTFFVAQAQQPPANQLVWAPKPVKPTGWTAPNKPHWKLAEALAKHTGQSDWIETVVSDDYRHADYISMGPGKKTPRRMNADTREWWVIQDGQIKFTIDGQEPFVASKGYLVQVPYRNMYSMETVGDKPSLRYEVNVANVTKMFPVEDTPAAVPGLNFVKVTIAGKGKYEAGNRPFIDFNKVVDGSEKQRRFIADDRAVANIIFGNGVPDPPLSNKGHFHEECSEFWFILLEQGPLQYRDPPRLHSRPGRYCVRSEEDVAPGEPRRRRTCVPSGHEWIPGHRAFVRGSVDTPASGAAGGR